MFVFDSKLFDQLLQFRLLRRMRLDLLEPAVGKVEVGVAAVGHRPVEDAVKLVDVHWNERKQTLSIILNLVKPQIPADHMVR